MIPMSKINTERGDDQQTIDNMIARLAGSNQHDGKLVVCIGSSILAQGTIVTSARWGYSANGPLEWAAILTGQRFRHVNKAISAKTTSDMTSWLEKEVLSLNPAVVIVQNGTNENGIGFDKIKGTSKNMYDQILDSGAQLIVSAMQTRTKADSGWTDDNLRTALALNNWKRSYCESHRRAHFADVTKYIVDPSNAYGEPLAGMLRDGTHYAPRGAFRAGKVYADILNSIFPPVDVLNPGVMTVGTNYVYGCESINPAFTGTSGTKGTGVTGTVPTGWAVERVSGTTTGTVAASVAAKSTLDPRRELTMTFTPGAGGDEEFYVRTSPAGFTPASLEDLYEALCGIDVSAWDGWKSITLECDDQGAGNKTFYDLSNIYDLPFPQTAWAGILRTVPFLPTGDIRMRFRIIIDGAASGTGTIKLFNPQCNRINPSSELDIALDTEAWRESPGY